MLKVAFGLTLVATAFAAPLDERQSGPSVTILNGTVVGKTSLGVVSGSQDDNDMAAEPLIRSPSAAFHTHSLQLATYAFVHHKY